jgi:hypothetical protein
MTTTDPTVDDLAQICAALACDEACELMDEIYVDDLTACEIVALLTVLRPGKIAFVAWFQNLQGRPTTDGGGALQRNPNSAQVFTSLFGAWARQLAGDTTHRFISSGTNRLRVR